MKLHLTTRNHPLFGTIDSRQDQLVDLLQCWIGCFPVYGSIGLTQVQRILGDRLSVMGFEVFHQEIDHEKLKLSPHYVDVASFGGVYADYNFAGRSNLIARRRFSTDGPNIILNGHIDVEEVSAPHLWDQPEGWRSGTIEGDRIYGRGASDTLGGVASFVHVLECLTPYFDVATGSMELQFVIDEEIGGNGTLGALMQLATPADLAIIVEPTNRAVCDSSMSFNQFAVECFGTPVHMSFASEFDNANRVACEVMSCLEELNDRFATSSGMRHVMYGYVSGGLDAALPAASAEVRVTLILPAEVDAGRVQTEMLEEVLARLAGRCNRPPKLKPFGIDFPGTRPTSPELVDTLLEQSKVLGIELRSSTFPSPCDARLFEAFGIPSVIYGPGCLSRAHGPNEYVRIPELLDHCKTVSGTLLSLWRRGTGAV